MASILISCFLLGLRQMNAHPNGETGRSISLPTLQGASLRVQSAILNEFGDTMFNTSAKKETASKGPILGGSADLEGGEGSNANPRPVASGISEGSEFRKEFPIYVGGAEAEA
jgi:hypothetical protein